MKLERQLKDQPTTKLGGSDLEMQLMQNLVLLRTRADELDRQAREEEAEKRRAIEELEKERKDKVGVGAEVARLQTLKADLASKVNELKTRSQDLEKEKNDRLQELKDLRGECDMIRGERDETMVLLDRAINLKGREKEKQERLRKDADLKQSQLERLGLQKDKAFATVLRDVDQLLARVGRGETGITSSGENLRGELLGIRNEMRQLIRERNEKEPAGGANPRAASPALPGIRE